MLTVCKKYTWFLGIKIARNCDIPNLNIEILVIIFGVILGF